MALCITVPPRREAVEPGSGAAIVSLRASCAGHGQGKLPVHGMRRQPRHGSRYLRRRQGWPHLRHRVAHRPEARRPRDPLPLLCVGPIHTRSDCTRPRGRITVASSTTTPLPSSWVLRGKTAVSICRLASRSVSQSVTQIVWARRQRLGSSARARKLESTTCQCPLVSIAASRVVLSAA